MKKIIILAIALLAITIAKAEKTATLNIKKNEFHRDKATRDIFGGLTEHIANFWAGPNGFWAQELTNRGFDHLEYTNEFPNGRLTYWKINQGDSSKLYSWYESSNKNGIACLKFMQYNNEILNVEQKISLTDSVDYNFYFYARKEWSQLDNLNSEVRITLSALDEQNELVILDSKVVKIDSLVWRKFSLKLNGRTYKKIRNNTGKITIAAENNSVFYLDEASLMPDNNFKGVRKEHYDLYKKAKIGLLRYPGGCFADLYANKWQNSIEHIDQRLSYISILDSPDPQRMEFGLLEYIHFCKEMQISPYITVNFGNGTAEDAANLVEFCNADTNTVFGRKRMLLGDTLPYNVKYFEIGNEQWFDKVGYIKGYLKFYDNMRAKDSNFLAVIDGNQWDPTSFDSLMSIVKEKCQVFGYHGTKGYFLDSKNPDSLLYLYNVDATTEKNTIDFYSQKIKDYKLENKLVLGNTEWWSGTLENEWVHDKYKQNAELVCGLWNASTLMIYLNHPDIFKVGCRTIGIGFIRREFTKEGKKSIFGTPGYVSFAMLSQHFGENIHKFDLENTYYSNYNSNLWINESPYIESLVSSNNDSLFISVVNKHPNSVLKFKINADNIPIYTRANHYEMWSEKVDDANSADEPNKIAEKTFANVLIDKEIALKPHSFNIIGIPIVYKNNKLDINTIDLSVEDVNIHLIKDNNIRVRYNSIDKLTEIYSDFVLNNVSIDLFDLNGNLLYKSNLITFDATNLLEGYLSSGVYYAKITDKNGNFVVKSFLVQN